MSLTKQKWAISIKPNHIQKSSLICCFCLFFFALTEGGLIDLKAYGQIPDTTSPIFSDSPPPPPPTSYLPLSHFDHYESTTISASPVLPAASIEPVERESDLIEATPAEELESSVDVEGRKHDDDVEIRGEIQHDTRPDFDELDKMHALISEPMIESSEFEQIERSYEIVESSDVPDDDDLKAASGEPLVDIDTGRVDEPEEMLMSTENVEQFLEQVPPVQIEETIDETQQEADVAAQLEELHRLKSSSYEDIYKETDFVPEKPGPPPTEVDVGDRFDTKHEEDLFGLSENGKSSSFENVYVESTKEAGDVEEKDVDEYEIVKQEVEADLEHEEKGAAENEKDVVAEIHEQDDLEKAEQYDTFETQLTEECKDVPKASPETPELKVQGQSFPAPIDGTYESGLDHVGQEEDQVLSTSAGSDSLGRSLSCDAEPEQIDSTASSPRQRHYSFPDETMHRASLEEIVFDDKGID